MTDRYENPLITRYASKEMSYIFSDDKKFSTWRKLWIALAESEMELGLDVISQEQIDEMKAHIYDINYDVANEREKQVRHDVMAHVYAYSQLCPKAAPIIHLGATSCYVTDNADIINIYEALLLVKKKLVNTIDKLSAFALKYKDMPTLGFTHLQPAQLTTVGKRATLWTYELILDYYNLEFLISQTRLRGVKGTTGTQASFLNLFDGDHAKVKKLEKLVVKKLGFDNAFAVTGQTYTRKYDSNVLNVLSGIAQSASKFANDIRILQSIKEVEEPFEKSQIGSSAMAYKRNPMRCERITALSRYVMSLPTNTAFTSATQWMERTLDDSANRRIVIGQAFLAIDAVLNLYMNVSENLVVNDKVIEKHIKEELPFMATENIMMACVKAGGNRQELHEKIRELSMQASYAVKKEGKPCNLIELIKNDNAFAAIKNDIDSMINPNDFVGRSPQQVIDFVECEVKPIIEKNKKELGATVIIEV
jgi:adenylosuccinate lyase